MSNVTLKNLQKKFKQAQIEEDRRKEKEIKKFQIDKLKENSDEEFHPIINENKEPLSNNEAYNIKKIKKELQKKFKDGIQDIKEQEEKQEKAFKPIIRELSRIEKAVKENDLPGKVVKEKEIILVDKTPVDKTPAAITDITLVPHSSVGPSGIREIASKYLTRNDTTFGIWFDNNSIAHIGDKKIIIDGNDIIIENKKFNGTEGLWVLLSKGVQDELYTDDDLEKYKEIVLYTNCMYQNNDPNTNKPKSSSGKKWKEIISPIWFDHLKKGSGLLKYSENPIEYKYINPNNNLKELKDRIDYLYAQEKAGNNNFHNEKLAILHFISDQVEKNIDNPKGIENLRILLNDLIVSQKKGSGVFNSLLNSKFMPEMHLPGYNYCGPFTKLDKRLAQGDKGINKLDEGCKKHDIFYRDHKEVQVRNLADKELEDIADEILFNSDSSLKERHDALIVKAGMKTKRYFGMGFNHEAI